MNHVVIIGFMGSGKTRVGKQLSKDLGLPFVDLEKIITKRMNLSAREIFERFGEPYYRALETLALKQLIQDSERKVISLGAGLPLQEQNEKYLRELGTVVYLKGSLATLKFMPLLKSSNPPLNPKSSNILIYLHVINTCRFRNPDTFSDCCSYPGLFRVCYHCRNILPPLAAGNASG